MGDEGDIGKMVYARRLSVFRYIEQQRKSMWLLQRGKNQNTKEGRKGTISQSTLRHLPNYSLIETVSMTVLWVTSTPCAW